MIIGAIAIYLLLCFALYAGQRSLLYHPTRMNDPHGAEVEVLVSDDEQIRVFTRKANSSNAVILFGGNADDVSAYLGQFARSIPDENLFLVNYRGYGGSTGTPSEAALFADATAIYDRVRSRYSNVSVVGRSLGTGVAVYLASVRDVQNLILITPYDSIENVAGSHLPIFPIGLLIKDKYDSASRADAVTARTLFLIAEHDRTIPRKHSDALIDRFEDPKPVVKILPGTDHASITSSPEFYASVREFLSAQPAK